MWGESFAHNRSKLADARRQGPSGQPEVQRRDGRTTAGRRVRFRVRRALLGALRGALLLAQREGKVESGAADHLCKGGAYRAVE